MAKVTKDGLVDLIQAGVELENGKKATKKESRAYLDAVLGAIHTALANGDDVALQGHGVYEKRDRAARTGRNPQTGEAIEIAASSTVGFRPTGIKGAVRN